ncbi:MAG: class I SAM-dependent methyltransferase [Lachnospiraceae bacterium]|nr:class I SAM-dependent methyltransferase [Lachnospiraceae bacterium]
MKNIILHRSCPACGNQIGRQLYRIDYKLPDDIHLGNGYDIVCCDNCGNCYADTASSKEDYDDYYNHNNYYGGGWKFNASTDYDYAVISRILAAYLSEDSMILDMGCGNGNLLNYLRQEGYHNLVGIDPSEASIDSIVQYGFQGIIGSVYQPPLSDIKVDFVIMTMVFEHLLCPEEAIDNIRKNYLKKDGYLLLTWPRFEDLMIDQTPIVNNFNHEHINYFSVKTADILLGRCGFERVCAHTSIGFQRNMLTTLSNVVLYRRMDSKTDLIEKDEITEKSIREYVVRGEKEEEELICIIERLAHDAEPVVVWGTGSYMMHLMAVSDLSKCDIRCFVDNNRLKQGKTLYGYSVESPDFLREFSGKVVITVMLYREEIKKQIDGMGNNSLMII